MAISLSDIAAVPVIGDMPTAPVRSRSVRVSLAATDVYKLGGLDISSVLAAYYPGESVRGRGLKAILAGATMRLAEVKLDAVAGYAYTGDDGTGGTETWNLTNGDTLQVIVDGGAPQTVTFNTGDFVDIDAATADEIVTVINTDVVGATASADPNNRVIVVSDTTGAESSVVITNVTGTATELHFEEDAATGHHTGTDAGTPRLKLFEDSTAGMQEVPSGTDISGHSPIDMPIVSA